MFTWPIRVYWEDTDAGGIVFYANYLKFFERARTEWLRSLGVHQQALKTDTGGMFVVTDTALSYKLPARLDDALLVTARISQAGRASLQLQQEAYKVVGDEKILLCEGTIRIGWVNAGTLQAARIPSSVLDVLK
jgi:acyl-CoA thioester hydrolase